MPTSDDPAKRARQRANLLPGLSSDPEARARQLANLQSGNVKHAALGGKALDETRARHERELAEDYPLLDRRRRAILADRLARVELASKWVAEKGLGPRGKKAGQVFPIADRLESWSRRCEDMLAAAEAEAAEAAAQGHGTSLEAIAAELAAGDDDTDAAGEQTLPVDAAAADDPQDGRSLSDLTQDETDSIDAAEQSAGDGRAE